MGRRAARSAGGGLVRPAVRPFVVRPLSSSAPPGENDAKTADSAAPDATTATENNDAAPEPDASAEPPAAPEGAASADFRAELDALASERDDLKNKWMRALAEAENARTIARRDVSNAREYAIQSFAKSMLEISDSLAYALEAAKTDPSLDALVEGVDLTRGQLVKAFNAHGLIEYAEPGDKFDPQLHEALYEYEDAEKEAATVGQVLKTGFKLHSRVIRAAQVGVVKATSPPPPPKDEA